MFTHFIVHAGAIQFQQHSTATIFPIETRKFTKMLKSYKFYLIQFMFLRIFEISFQSLKPSTTSKVACEVKLDTLEHFLILQQ